MSSNSANITNAKVLDLNVMKQIRVMINQVVGVDCLGLLKREQVWKLVDFFEHNQDLLDTKYYDDLDLLTCTMHDRDPEMSLVLMDLDALPLQTLILIAEEWLGPEHPAASASSIKSVHNVVGMGSRRICQKLTPEELRSAVKEKLFTSEHERKFSPHQVVNLLRFFEDDEDHMPEPDQQAALEMLDQLPNVTADHKVELKSGTPYYYPDHGDYSDSDDDDATIKLDDEAIDLMTAEHAVKRTKF